LSSGEDVAARKRGICASFSSFPSSKRRVSGRRNTAKARLKSNQKLRYRLGCYGHRFQSSKAGARGHQIYRATRCPHFLFCNKAKAEALHPTKSVLTKPTPGHRTKAVGLGSGPGVCDTEESTSFSTSGQTDKQNRQCLLLNEGFFRL
jgi:hypothetical protein